MTVANVDPTFDRTCQRCERLATFLSEVRHQNPDYYAAPVPPFGERGAPLLIVGLAPGMHGANATGRPFTGDHAGILLYETLYAHGFSNQARGESPTDGLKLRNCRVTNAVKCLPPANKPKPTEVAACNPYLAADLADRPPRSVIIALGRVAHQAVIKALNLRQAAYPFGHAAIHAFESNRWLVDSYHCSRYNTQTKRLTKKMFNHVFELAKGLLE